ncbi:MAG: M28 family peptidase, partial [Fimbriimonadales bacterium]|nr:M28 family peptidase [Fimbriimonadales bacterium]
ALSGMLAWLTSNPSLQVCASLGSLTACALYWGLVSGRWEVMRLFPKCASANLIGVIPAGEQPLRKVVLMAHIDTQRATLLWHPKLVRQFGQSFQIQTALLALHGTGAMGLLGSLLLQNLNPNPQFLLILARWLMLPGALLSVWGMFVLLHREFALEWVQGANDNGSGVAVVLSLLMELAQQPLPKVEVWGVFTGCEEVGTPAGAFAFEREYGLQLRDALFLIIDHVGLGEPRYLLTEAMLPRAHAHPEMANLMQQLAQAHPEWSLQPSAVPHGAYTDALPFLIKGYQAIALWCEQQPGIPPNWHWATDVLENVNPTDLERMRAIVRTVLEAVQAHASG